MPDGPSKCDGRHEHHKHWEDDVLQNIEAVSSCTNTPDRAPFYNLISSSHVRVWTSKQRRTDLSVDFYHQTLQPFQPSHLSALFSQRIISQNSRKTQFRIWISFRLLTRKMKKGGITKWRSETTAAQAKSNGMAEDRNGMKAFHLVGV